MLKYALSVSELPENRRKYHLLFSCWHVGDDYLFLYVRLGRFSVKNVTPTKEGESSKIKVKIRMDIHGIFYVSKAQMIEKIPSDDEGGNEPMETQPAAETENSEKNITDAAQDGVKNGPQVA